MKKRILILLVLFFLFPVSLKADAYDDKYGDGYAQENSNEKQNNTSNYMIIGIEVFCCVVGGVMLFLANKTTSD